MGARFKQLPANCRLVNEPQNPGKPPNIAQVERTPPKTPELPPAPVALNQQAKNRQTPEQTAEQKRDALPRPRFTLATHDYGGFRFVAHGINSAQAAALCKAAEEAGIQEQN